MGSCTKILRALAACALAFLLLSCGGPKSSGAPSASDDFCKDLLDVEADIYQAIEHNDMRAFRTALCRRDQEADTTERGARSPLHTAASLDRIGMLRALLARGLDPNARIYIPSGGPSISEAIFAKLNETVALLPPWRGRIWAETVAALLDPESKDDRPIRSPAALRSVNNKMAFEHLVDRMPVILPVPDSKADHFPRYGITPLFAAVQGGRTDAAALLMEHGADVNAVVSGYAISPLHLACMNDDLEMAKRLVEGGADIDARGITALTPLAIAVARGRKDLVEYLLSKGADPAPPVRVGFSPRRMGKATGHAPLKRLHYNSLDAAAWQKDIAILKAILDTGVPVVVPGRRSPLFLAVLAQNLPAVEILIGAGALKGEQTASQILDLAIRLKNEPLIERLVALGAKARSPSSKFDTTPLFLMEHGYVKTAETLLEKRLDINIRMDGRTLLHAAAMQGRLPLIKTLLEKGLCVHSRDGDGHTPLDYALRNCHGETARYLIDQGAVIEEGAVEPWRDEDAIPCTGPAVTRRIQFTGLKRSALMEAARCGDAAWVSKLLSLGANPRFADNKGRTPLHEAAAGGDPDVIRMIRAAGGEVDARDKDDNTPLLIAVFDKQTKAAAALIDLGADIYARNKDMWKKTDAWEYAIKKRDRDLIALLLKKGADPDRPVLLQNTWPRRTHPFLFFAIEKDLEELMWTLIKGGARLDELDENGATALTLLLERGDEAEAKRLIAKRPDLVKRCDKQGRCPLHLVGTRRMYDLLVERGADEAAETDQNETAALTAAYHLLKHIDAINTFSSPEEVSKSRAAIDEHFELLFHIIDRRKGDALTKSAAGQTPLTVLTHAVILLQVMSEWLDISTLRPLAAAVDDGIVRLIAAGDRTVLSETPAPLVLMSRRCEVPLVKMIIGEAPPLDDKNKALRAAAEHGCLPAVRALVGAGADRLSKNDLGLDARCLADIGRHEAVERFLSKGADPPTFCEACASDQEAERLLCRQRYGYKLKDFILRDEPSRLDQWLSDGVAPGDPPIDGMTPLHYIIQPTSDWSNRFNERMDRERQVRIAAALLDHGLDVNALSEVDVRLIGFRKSTLTPLHLAVIHGNREMVRFLLERGADPNKPDDSGRTPLHSAVAGGHTEIVALLRQNKAADARFEKSDADKKKSCAASDRGECPLNRDYADGRYQRCMECGRRTVVRLANGPDTPGAEAMGVCCHCGQVQPYCDDIVYWRTVNLPPDNSELIEKYCPNRAADATAASTRR